MFGECDFFEVISEFIVILYAICSDSMMEDSDDLNFIASEKGILKDAEEAAKLQKKDNDFL